MSILLLGAGNMGSSFIPSLVQEFTTENLYLSDTDEKKLELLKSKFKLKHISNNFQDFLDKVEYILLAIKPQSFFEIGQILKEKAEDKTIISIMAGVSIKKIQNQTGCQKVIRSMPNLAVSVQKSVIGYTFSNQVLVQDKIKVKKIFENLGYALELESEDKINQITALSGSGPAYFFYLTEILQKQALEFGFNTNQARKIAENTLLGAAKLVQENDFDSKTWKDMVTSKGGTTEAALNYLKQNKFDKIFQEAIKKAKDRALELA
jgi:pyrroline-5-carboxylate reductase